MDLLIIKGLIEIDLKNQSKKPTAVFLYFCAPAVDEAVLLHFAFAFKNLLKLCYYAEIRDAHG